MHSVTLRGKPPFLHLLRFTVFVSQQLITSNLKGDSHQYPFKHSYVSSRERGVLKSGNYRVKFEGGEPMGRVKQEMTSQERRSKKLPNFVLTLFITFKWAGVLVNGKVGTYMRKKNIAIIRGKTSVILSVIPSVIPSVLPTLPHIPVRELIRAKKLLLTMSLSPSTIMLL